MLAAFVLLVQSGSGCTELQRFVPQGLVNNGPYSQEDLREEIGDFSSRFQFAIGSTADAIASSDAPRHVKRTALLWRLRVAPLIQEAAFEPNPQEAFVSTLTLMVLMRRYVTEGEARDLFGEQQELVVRVSRDLEEELVHIGERFMGVAEMESVRQEVEDFARGRPVGGSQFAIQAVGQTLAEVEQTNVFSRVAGIPLAPFRALGGVGDSPAAIRSFTATTRDFVRVLERVPQQVRWQLELLLYDLEDRETIVESLALLESVAGHAQQVSEAAARLPADLQGLLGESGRILGQLERVLGDVQAAARPLSETARSLEAASASWASILDSDEEKSGAPPGERFDVRDLESAAREIGDAAEQLRELATELQTLASAPGDLPQISATLNLADAAARGWIDRLAWRLLQLLGAFFVLLLLYRWIAVRLVGRTSD